MNLPDDCGPEDFLAWTHDRMTRAFFASLQDDRQAIMQAWAQKRFIGENADQTNFLNARGLAKLETIDEILVNLQESIEDAREAVKAKQQEN